MITSQIMVAVGAVIEDDEGRILLVKHKPERGGFWQRKWICPGGKLELGETIAEGIKREIKEETGLEIELVRPLPAFDRIVKSAGGVSLHVVYISYVAKLAGGELKVDSDVGEALWVNKEELDSIWKDMHEDAKELLKLAGMV
ncbi:MAG: NUDIX domain-containing protein [Chloroflexi bacterium]|nr:NUDIX domain-containing protein [Chloroflexota bacterium]